MESESGVLAAAVAPLCYILGGPSLLGVKIETACHTSGSGRAPVRHTLWLVSLVDCADSICFFSLSLSLSVYLCLSVFLSVFLYVSLSLSLSLSLTALLVMPSGGPRQGHAATTTLSLSLSLSLPVLDKTMSMPQPRTSRLTQRWTCLLNFCRWTRSFGSRLGLLRLCLLVSGSLGLFKSLGFRVHVFRAGASFCESCLPFCVAM